MKSFQDRRWETIYKLIGKGEMNGCKRENCPSSCCDVDRLVKDVSDKTCRLVFKTIFYDAGELGYFERANRKVKLPVKIHEGLIFGSNAYFLSDCRKEDGSCVFDDAEMLKPLECRIFPFQIHANYPLALKCPQVVEIYENNPVIRDSILEVRNLLGKNNNNRWYERVVLLISITKILKEKNNNDFTEAYRVLNFIDWERSTGSKESLEALIERYFKQRDEIEEGRF